MRILVTALTAALCFFWAPKVAAEPTLLTRDQRQVDTIALELLRDPSIQAAKETGRRFWQGNAAASIPDGASTLDGAIDEATYLAVRSAVAHDPIHPRIIWTSGAPYRYDNIQVPGSRWGGDNPDRVYRTFAVDAGHRYLLRGRRARTPSNEEFSFEAVPTITLGPGGTAYLRSDFIDIAHDGKFEITIDAAPTAPGQRNHLTIAPGSRMVLVRETLADWGHQIPNRLSVERIDDMPAPTPRTPEGLRQEAAAEVVRAIQLNAALMAHADATPPNTLTARIRQSGQGVDGSAGALSRFRLADDEALVITVDPKLLGAEYVNLQLTDLWFRSIPYWNRTSSLSDKQMTPNPDGSLTFIVSRSDPGFRNWLNTGGLHEGLMLLRMEQLTHEQAQPPQDLIRDVRLVKTIDLARALPAPMARLTPLERTRQLQQREHDYRTRERR